MKQIEPWMPEHLELIEEEMDFLPEMKKREEWVGAKTLKKLTGEGADFSTLCFSKVRFENCCFIECNFQRCEFTDVIFRACNFSNCTMTDVYFNRCQFISTKGIGSNFSGSGINNLTIQDSCFNYANFDECKLENIKVIDTEMNGANISQCRCKEVLWERVQLKNASFFKTYLNGMDFTTSTIEGLVLTDDCRELKGAVVDLYQAAELAKRLGVVIK